MNNGSTAATARTTNDSLRSSSNTSPLQNRLVSVRDTSTALVASLNRAFSGASHFTIMSRILDRQSSPELTKIKAIVKVLPAIEFQTLLEMSTQIQDSNSRIQNYRRETFLNRAFIRNEPEFKRIKEVRRITSWFAEEENKFGTCGGQSISDQTSEIRQNILWIENEADKVDSKIRAIQILKENTEYWQGFWDVIKDKSPPDFSAGGDPIIEPLLQLVKWVAELIVNGIVYDQSWEREKFLEVLNTWEDMLTRDHKLILATKAEMMNHLEFVRSAQGLWSAQVCLIWLTRVNDTDNIGNAIKQYEACVRDLDKAERMMSLTIKPFEQALNQLYPFHGTGISVQRSTRDFCDHVPYITNYLKKLLTAKGIISDSQAELFEEKVYGLARIIYGRLETINELCAQWSKPIDPGELKSFLEEGTADFLVGTNQVILAIKSIVQNETRDSKKKQAAKKRMEWDRRYKNWDWKDRPLVNSAGVNDVLEELEVIIRVIHGLSVSTGTGTNMLSIGKAAEVRRSQVEFNRSNSLLNEFFDVLRDEIQRGSMGFPEKRVKRQTETKKSHGGLFRRQWKKWWGAKPSAPSPMEELGPM